MRAELVEEVAYVRPDRVHRYGQLAGDLRHGQVGRQVTQHPDLGLAQRIYQAEGVCWPGRTLRRPWVWFRGWPFGWSCGELATDLGRQGGLVTLIRGIAIEQLPGGGMEQEDHQRTIGRGYLERAPQGVPGGRVTECVPGDRLQQPGERQPARRGGVYVASQDRRERSGGGVRVTLGDPQRGQGHAYHAAGPALLADFRDVLLGAPELAQPHQGVQPRGTRPH